VVVVGGDIAWSAEWIDKLRKYVHEGGVLVLNATQGRDLPVDLLGLTLTPDFLEADRAVCGNAGESAVDLSGQLFRYQKVALRGATALMQSSAGDPLVTVNKLGKGIVVFNALPDLLGEDERVTPFAAHMLEHVFAGVSPIKVSGDVEYLLNRNSRGWVVTLINNNGVFKPQQGMAQVDRTAKVTAAINFRGVVSASDWVSEKRLSINGDTVNVEIAPGGIAVVELVTGSP
jgi:hypothetical protein